MCGVWGVWVSQSRGMKGRKQTHMYASAWENTKGSLQGSSSDALELELQTIRELPDRSVGNQTLALWKNNKHS